MSAKSGTRPAGRPPYLVSAARRRATTQVGDGSGSGDQGEGRRSRRLRTPGGRRDHPYRYPRPHDHPRSPNGPRMPFEEALATRLAGPARASANRIDSTPWLRRLVVHACVTSCAAPGPRVIEVELTDLDHPGVGGRGDLFVVNADGTGLQRLGDGSRARFDPVWSPDGTLIAYRGQPLNDPNSTTSSWVISPDGQQRYGGHPSRRGLGGRKRQPQLVPRGAIVPRPHRRTV